MRIFLQCLVSLIVFVFLLSPAQAQTILFEDYFTDGVTSLNWFSAWKDDLGTPLTNMVAVNETGPTDDWIGVLTGDLDSLGSMGATLAGESSLDNYSVEAQVYIELSSGYYSGLMMRVDTTSGKVTGYQLITKFNAAFGPQKVLFRYFSDDRTEIRVLAEIGIANLPGGAPVADGWHKMKIKAIGNQFWLYWNDQEIAGSPFTDPDAALSHGYFGVYVWDAMSGIAPTTKVDDYIVREEGIWRDYFTDGITSLNWFSAWKDDLGTPLTNMVAVNETGPTDDWIGVLTGDLDSLGSMGATLAGESSLDNYSVEAQVYIELSSGYYSGLMMRVDTTSGKVTGYQLITKFNAAFGPQKVLFRYFSDDRTEIRVLADIGVANLPGGAPAADGWHKMKIKAVGNLFWLYWNDQEINGSPFTDPDAALSQGYFGVYVWDAMSGIAPTTKVDDFIVHKETMSTGIAIRRNNIDQNIQNFELHANYPNPFNPTTNIPYQLNNNENVDLTIYNLLGRKISTLVSSNQPSGYYTVTWDGRDEMGNKVPSGIYVYTLKTSNHVTSKKMLLVK